VVPCSSSYPSFTAITIIYNIITKVSIKPFRRVTFSMGHAGASRKSPKDASWSMLSLRHSRPISAPFLTALLSWRQREELSNLTTECKSLGALIVTDLFLIHGVAGAGQYAKGFLLFFPEKTSDAIRYHFDDSCNSPAPTLLIRRFRHAVHRD